MIASLCGACIPKKLLDKLSQNPADAEWHSAVGTAYASQQQIDQSGEEMACSAVMEALSRHRKYAQIADRKVAQSYDQEHGERLYRRSLYTYWKRSSP
ncbi:hypothetical protein AB1L30_18145 [Bremerella sp. JC817]|uniref:hypothetical protein n=1 Tax=Bremerella sp. JC817 TaxID=3231756 RepID=UPI00345AEA39